MTETQRSAGRMAGSAERSRTDTGETGEPRAATRREFLAGAVGFGVVAAVVVKRGASKPVIDVRDHGAKGDGKHDDTKAIQQAVDEAARRRGTVKLGKGRYRCGTVRLRDHTTMLLGAGATILLSKDPSDFLPRRPVPHTFSDFETSDFQNSLLHGDGVRDITVYGNGTIDGGSDHRYGPKPIALYKCRQIAIAGITIRNAANYCISLGGCDDVQIRGVTIRDAFADGIDPDCCTNVRIVGCDIESDDDAVVLKSSLILGAPRPTEDVVVSRCRLNSPSNGFKIGTETSGDVRNVRVEHCRIDGTPRKGADPANLVLSEEGGGIAIESVDGAVVEKIEISSCTVTSCDVPIFVRLGSRGRGQTSGPAPGAVRDVTIKGITATKATDACTISGIPGHPIEQLTLEDVTMDVIPATAPPTAPIPELEGEYPQAGMFGALPAAGVYARHVAGLTLTNVKVTVGGVVGGRSVLVTDDVSGLVAQPPL